MKRDSITIRPTPESLIWNAGEAPPVPCFIVESGSHTRLRSVDIEVAADPESFRNNPGSRFETGSRLERGGNLTWQFPSDVWEGYSQHPRIFYRAIGRMTSGRTVFSLDEAMINELPFLHGRPSGLFYAPSQPFPSLPPLRVVGTTVLQEGRDAPFLLCGVNVSGLNHARYFYGSESNCSEMALSDVRTRRWRDAAQVTPALFDRLKKMHVNLVRIPLNQDWALMGYHEPELPEFRQLDMRDALRYLEDIDQIVAWAAERGIYVMLSLHTLRLSAPQTGMKSGCAVSDSDSFEQRLRLESHKQPYNAHLPDHRSWLFWSVLAHRYRGSPAVLFDLCNEPHEVNSDYWDSAEYRGVLPPMSSLRIPLRQRQDTAWWIREWHRRAEALEGIVHRINPEALVFISGFGGPCWSASLDHMNIRTYNNNRNVILAVHWYWSEALGPETWRRHLGLEMKPTRSQKGSPASGEFPVFVKEWGVETPEATTQESALLPPSDEYKRHWARRMMPEYSVLIEWARRLCEFFIGLAEPGVGRLPSGFAGFAAWSTGDKPRIFEREGVSAGPYKKGFPLTDYGRIVEAALARLARMQEYGGPKEPV